MLPILWEKTSSAMSTTAVEAISVLEALSGIAGSVSIACWVFLIVPQLVVNYRNGSAEGLSPIFLTVWLLGDICSLAGAVWAKLLPTLIVLGLYFCVADLIVLSQVVFYNHLESKWLKRHSLASSVDENGGAQGHNANVGSERRESEPLLNRSESNTSRRRRSSAASRRRLSSMRRRDSLSAILEEKGHNAWHSVIVNGLSIGGIVAAGAVGWLIAWQTGAWMPVNKTPSAPGEHDMPIGAEVLGYISSILYLFARVPQIYRNWRKQSCEGLSILFFMLSLLGNGTYGASILFHSTDKDYVIKNLPWLLGSLGTMVEDLTIFAQFRIYAVPGGIDVDNEIAVE